MWLSIIVLAVVVSNCRAPIFLTIDDPEDDTTLVDAVSGQKPVEEFAAEIEAFEKKLLANDLEKIEKLLGKPGPRPEKGYAMPIGQHRKLLISGLRHSDKKMNKNHTDYYPIGDFAGIEVSYGINGTSPQFAVLYFKVDNQFPRLTVTNMAERLKWDRDKFAKVKKYIEGDQPFIPATFPIEALLISIGILIVGALMIQSFKKTRIEQNGHS